MVDEQKLSSPKSGWRSLLWPAAFALPVYAVLMGLGIWQLERLSWKEGVLAQIDDRTHAAPAAIPPASAWPGLKPDDYEYRRITVSGVFEHDRETYVFRGSGNLRGQPGAPGYHVLTPLLLPDGSRVLVNRGFAPQDRRDPATRRAGLLGGDMTVVGLMRSPDERNMFTPVDDPAKRIWYTRDPAAVATALGLGRLAPFVIDSDDTPVPGGLPQGGVTEIKIPNNHLSYAATWFGLAVTLVGVFGVFAWRRVRA